jgi:hypothetical protein
VVAGITTSRGPKSDKRDEMEIPAGGAVAFAPRGLFLTLIEAVARDD